VWTFEVWGPAARSVELSLGDLRQPLQRAGAGWWALAVERAGPGDRYGFSLDGGPIRPDPRAMALPEGVHGPAEVVDHSTFAWTDARWRGLHLPGSVLYEMHVGTFTPEGTFDAATGRLGHLVDLGVDALEVMPVAAFDGPRGWGYDGVGLYAPHPAYGGPDGFKRFVDACHAAGLGVILDVVYNHLGPSGNYLAEFGPYFSPTHRTHWGDGVNLDGPGSDEVRRFFVDNALMWLRDYHLDGLRLDAVHALADRSARPFLEQLADEVSRLAAGLGRPLALIAESDLNDPRFVSPPAAGGFGLDSAWADEWHHAWHAAFSGERDGYYVDFGPLDLLAKALAQAWVYDGCFSPHRGRTHGRPPLGLDGSRFVVFTQNHDQVGNRAAGDRSAAWLSPGRLKVSAGLALTSPFVPLLFQGEEWGASSPWRYFTSFPDAELGRAVTEGRRSEFASFGWDPTAVPDPQAVETFLASKLDWSELGKSGHVELLAWYRELIGCRRRHPDLTDPALHRTRAWVDDDLGGIVVERGSIWVAALIGDRTASLTVGPARILAASEPGIGLDGGRLRLVPDSVAVVERGPADQEARGAGGWAATAREAAAAGPTPGPAPVWAPQ
jgi:maltooligosyltrehalose trehalohydrolase